MNIHHDVRCTLPDDHKGQCTNLSRIVISVALEIDEESVSAAGIIEEVQSALEAAIDADTVEARLVSVSIGNSTAKTAGL